MVETLNFLKCIVLGGLSLIQNSFAQTQLFPYCGKNAWLAKINGTDLEKNFNREFIEKDWSDARKLGTDGVLCFRNLTPGLYEFRNFVISDDPANWKANGFVLMTDDGVMKVSEDVALKIAKLLDHDTWEDLEARINWDDLFKA